MVMNFSFFNLAAEPITSAVLKAVSYISCGYKSSPSPFWLHGFRTGSKDSDPLVLQKAKLMFSRLLGTLPKAWLGFI